MNAAAEDTTLEIIRLFDATPTQVFEAWLHREEWQAWIGVEGMVCEVPVLEPHIGGKYHINMRLSTGQVIPVTGVFKSIEPPTRLVFTWGWENDSHQQSLITLTFRDKAGKTELTLRQEGLGSVANRDDNGRGWNSALNKLVAYLKARQH